MVGKSREAQTSGPQYIRQIATHVDGLPVETGHAVEAKAAQASERDLRQARPDNGGIALREAAGRAPFTPIPPKTPATTSTIFNNARFFTARGDASHPKADFASCMLIQDGTILHVGAEDDEPIRQAEANGAKRRDLHNRTVLPGFIDGHMHLLMLGQSLRKVNLEACKNLDDIRAAIAQYAAAHPEVPRILCRGWMHSMTNGEALACNIDDLDPRPIFIDAKDLHSTWCNSAALAELGVETMKDPPGGTIHRDEGGKASGLLSEAAAVTLVWPHVARIAPMEAKLAALRGAISAYSAAGYTGVVDMAMDENAWTALEVLRAQEKLPIRIAAHWLISPSGSEAGDRAQVDRAAALHARYNAVSSPDFRIAGIKVILDGVIDACTAALTQPYATGAPAAGLPLWTSEILSPVVAHASAANLQCALHAIGDAAINLAISTLATHAGPSLRPRIEHLELASAADAARLGALGITASIQPVHADPAILRAWPTLLGSHRCGRAFAYKEFADNGATLAIGTDAPTAPFAALANLYVATTRRSAREPTCTETVNPSFSLPLPAAVAAATAGAAWACFGERRAGKLEAGLRADFAIVDMQWEGGGDQLLNGRVVETWFDGVRVFSAA